MSKQRNNKAGDGKKKKPVTNRLPNEAFVTNVLGESGVPVTDVLKNANEKVTDRATSDGEQITSKMEGAGAAGSKARQAGSVTDVQPEKEQEKTFQAQWREGDLINDRYQITAGPLSELTGEAQIFLGLDRHTDFKVVIKIYLHVNIAPKLSVLEQFLNIDHPDIVSLQDYGTWGGHFYEVMEWCEGGTLVDYAPYTEEELRPFLQEIINGLKYCHDRGIVHRDIKPNNFFFRKPGKEDVVLGDFGISSILMEGEVVKKTKTSGNFTIDYTSPELLSENLVSVKTDYYSLGVTLIHLLNGQSPFRGKNNRAIMAAHFTGKIPYPPNLSESFQTLLRGLLRINPENRWGYNQVLAWLKGEPILTDDGHPDREDVHAGKGLPAYSRVPKATTPLELAKYLDDFDAEADLYRGQVRNWVHFFDPELADRIWEIEREYNYPEKRELGIFKLRYTLDSLFPYAIDGHPINDLKDLVALLGSEDEPLLKALEEAFHDGYLECWIETVMKGPQTGELLERLQNISERIYRRLDISPADSRRLEITALLHNLDPQVPLKLAAGAELRQPEGLEDLMAANPDLIERTKDYLFKGYFEEWLIAAFPDRKADVDFVRECCETYKSNKELGVYAFRWHLKPTIPFPYAGTVSAKTPKDLAALIDRSSQDQEHGINLLKKAWIRTWLLTTGQMEDASGFDRIVDDPKASWERKLESVLHLLDTDLPWPKLAVDQEEVRLGAVGTESAKTVKLRFFNKGRGFLAGDFSLAGKTQGVALHEPVPSLEGKPVTVTVQVRTQGMAVGFKNRALLVANTNGGHLEVPIIFRAGAPVLQMLLRSLRTGVILALVLGGLRALMAYTLPPHYGYTFMGWMTLWNMKVHSGLIFVGVWGLLLLALIGGGIYYLWRMVRVLGSH